MEVCGGLPSVCQHLDSNETACLRQSQLLRLGGTVMTSQNSVFGQKSVFRATAFGKARRCDRGPHVYERIDFHIMLVVCWKTILTSGKRAVQRSLWLCIV